MVKWPLQWLSDLQLGDKKVTLNHLEDGFSWVFLLLTSVFFAWSLTTLSPLDFHEIPWTHFAFDGRGGGTPGSWIRLTWAFERFTSKRKNYQLYTKDIEELMYTTTGFIWNDLMKEWWKYVKIIMMNSPCAVDYSFIHFVPPAPPRSSSMPKAEHDILVPRAPTTESQMPKMPSTCLL